MSSINCDFPYFIPGGRIGIDEKTSLSVPLSYFLMSAAVLTGEAKN